MEKKAVILIVDDEEGVTEAMQDMLEIKGYSVLTAGNGVAGLKILAETQIDLVILDLNMPRMDGYMFMEHARERWRNDGKRFSFPKILVMTAVDKKTDLGLANNLGANEFMNKPFKAEEFIAAVNSLLTSV